VQFLYYCTISVPYLFGKKAGKNAEFLPCFFGIGNLHKKEV